MESAKGMDGNSVNPERRALEFQLINGVFVQKFPVTISTYPEIHAHVGHLVEILENVYKIAVKRGMEIQEEHAWPRSNQLHEATFANPPCQDNTPDTTKPIE